MSGEEERRDDGLVFHDAPSHPSHCHNIQQAFCRTNRSHKVLRSFVNSNRTLISQSSKDSKVNQDEASYVHPPCWNGNGISKWAPKC